MSKGGYKVAGRLPVVTLYYVARDCYRLKKCFVVQKICLHESCEDCSVNEWFVGESPANGILKELFPAPSLAGRDEGPRFSSHELSRKTLEELWKFLESTHEPIQ